MTTFLAESPKLAASKKRLDIARAEVTAARILPNPTLGVDREQVVAAGASSDQNRLSVQFPLPLSGRIGIRQELADTGVMAAETVLKQEIFRQSLDFRAAYVSAHFAEARVEVLESSKATFQRLDRIIAARAKAGEGAGYDRMRMKQASAALAARLASAKSTAQATRASLSGQLGRPMEGSLHLVEAIASPPSNEKLQAAAVQRPDIVTLQTAQRQMQLTRKLGERSRWADPALLLGIKQTTEPTIQGLGYVAGLSWPIPIFNQGAGEVARAEAEQTRLIAEEAAVRQGLAAEIPTARDALNTQIDAASRYLQDSLEHLPALLRVAEIAYQEGDASIVSLLDAQQAAIDARLQYLELLEAAQTARNNLERLVGTPLSEIK